MAFVKVPGVLFDFNGRQLVLAPLNMGAMRQLLERSKTMSDATSLDSIDMVIDAVHASLKRNYPDITHDEVLNDLVDAANAEHLMPIIMNRSGLEKVMNDTPRKEAIPGEALGSIPGSTSTPTLVPSPVGLSNI